MATAEYFIILVKVDEVHQQFIAGLAPKAGRMPAGLWSGTLRKNGNITSGHGLRTPLASLQEKKKRFDKIEQRDI